MNIDFTKLINQLPSAFAVKAKSADEVTQDAVILTANFARQLGQFGITANGADYLYTARPFAVPNDRIAITLADGETINRRIAEYTDCPYFVSIQLGEEC